MLKHHNNNNNLGNYFIYWHEHLFIANMQHILYMSKINEWIYLVKTVKFDQWNGWMQISNQASSF